MSVFSKIIQGEIPCHKIAETDKYIAFLDVSPVAKGHTLAVPKCEVDYIFSLDADTLSGLVLFAQKVAAALKKSIACKRIGVAVIGLEVPHAHIHLVPLNSENDMDFKKSRLQFSQAEYEEIAANIRENL
jgi:histidine triad (HIT) family protein